MKLNYLIKVIKNQVLSISVSKRNFPLSNGLSGTAINNFLNIDIKGLSLNSKQIKKGYLFFCLSGSCYKDWDFINEAYLKGAVAVVIDKKVKSIIPNKLVVIRVKDVIECLGFLVDRFYGSRLDRLNKIALTGTDGKTTTTFILENILRHSKKSVGVIGTINYRFAKKVFCAKNTTPDILTTFDLMNRMVKNKVKYLLMEVSSHALAQRRIQGLKFDQAIFTNLSQDHLDYHKTREKYFVAKSLLFRSYLKENGVAIINTDDSYGRRLSDLIKKGKKNKVLTYGIKKKADVYANRILLRPNGSQLTVRTPEYEFKLKTNLLGEFNIYNILASISVCLILGIPQKYILKGLKEVYIPGRLERVICGNGIRIFVDYAHTQDALRNVLLFLKGIKGRGRLIVVFGCGGNRDRTKRHKMGRIASELSDFVVITCDNPRAEDPKRIISDIEKGIKKRNYKSIPDRKQAIKKAIDIARNKDIILVAGKGHETYQAVGDKKYSFNDRVVIEDILSGKGII